jgi:hypothetical protein
MVMVKVKREREREREREGEVEEWFVCKRWQLKAAEETVAIVWRVLSYKKAPNKRSV